MRRAGHGCGTVPSSGIFTGLYCLEFEQVFWFLAIAMVLPHLQIEPLQVYCVLLGVEKRAADSLLPNTCSDHLQAEEILDILRLRQRRKLPYIFYVRNLFSYYSISEPSFTATSSYSWRLWAISSGQPRQLSCEAATREARVSPCEQLYNIMSVL